MYAVNFFVMFLGFKFPFLYQILFNTVLLGSTYLGSHFQIVGLTGGIATGKSTVSQILAEQGFDIIDCDKIAKEVIQLFSNIQLMDTDKKFQQSVIKEFGNEILESDGKISRTKLGEIIFANQEKRLKLNKLSHPRIFIKMIKELLRLKFVVKSPLVVIDAPLLYESKFMQYFCYPIIVVYTEDAQTQLNRLKERNDLTEDEAMKKINAQMPISQKIQLADILIDNSEGLKELRKQVLHKSLPQIYAKMGYFDNHV